MDRFITSYDNITLWQVTRASLPSIARFVVEENYKHHKGEAIKVSDSSSEYTSILMEEESFFDYSSIIVAKNNSGSIVGAIRVTKWNDNPHTLPLIKIFGNKIVNPKSL